MTPSRLSPLASRLFTGISELYAPTPRLTDAALAVADGDVVWVGPEAKIPDTYRDWPKTDLGGRGVLPGLVDSHTHLVWAGNRLTEYRQRAAGESYEAILEAGGGIHNTVRATREASEDELVELALKRARIFLAGGVTALEIKSGYGLTLEHELKMLRVIRKLAERTPQRVVSTLLAHVVPQGWQREDYLAMFTRELLPEVARQGLAEAVDVFCDRGAFTLTETRCILEAALEHGSKVKAHAEQLSRTGAARLVAELGGLSADHLEVAAPEDWAALAASGTVGTVLPGAALILRKPFPDARAMWDRGVKVAVATDHNPGSSPLYSLLLALQLATALGGLTLEEALSAGTAHAADALGQGTWGRLRTGSPADFLVVDAPEALQPLYSWGHAPLHGVYIGGALVAGSAAGSTGRGL
jgi:imidazolonepropionase